MAETYSLPVSVVASIFQNLQGIFDFFRQQFADSVKSHMGFMWTDDTLFLETFVKVLFQKDAWAALLLNICFQIL